MPKYKVLESRQISKLGPTGASISEYRVWIKTGRGSTGSVDVSAADWKADRLREILLMFADELDLAFTLEA